MRIDRQDDYQNVANGTPRAEVSFGGIFRFVRGERYVIDWKTLIPNDYQFDAQQPELIAQIHQGPAAGYPPVALFISGSGQYLFHNRTQSRVDDIDVLFGSPMDDRGKWVDWRLEYLPDDTGKLGYTRLFRNGVRVVNIRDVPNAYQNDDLSYFKFGLYKADWKRKPSDVDSRTLFYGPLFIGKGDDVKVP